MADNSTIKIKTQDGARLVVYMWLIYISDHGKFVLSCKENMLVVCESYTDTHQLQSMGLIGNQSTVTYFALLARFV
jgi:hypothetical protein